MARMTEQQLEKWSAAITEQFFTEKRALNDGVTDVAEQESLNPEQVKRLVEAVNTAAFLKKFDSMSGTGADASKDRMVEFETASPDAVLNRLLGKAKDSMAGGVTSGDCARDDLSAALPVTRSDEAPDEPEEKAAEYIPAEPRIDREAVRKRLYSALDQFKAAEYQARVDFTEAFQQMADRFRRASGATFEEFEKDAFYRYGGVAAPHLQLLRQTLRLPTADYDVTEMRKYARIIDSRTPEMRALQQLLDHTAARKKYAQSVEKTEGYLGRL